MICNIYFLSYKVIKTAKFTTLGLGQRTSQRLNDKKSAAGTKSAQLSSESLFASWKKNQILVGSGRTCFVSRVQVGDEFLALKMVNVFTHPIGALDELDNEFRVMTTLSTT